MVCPVSILRIDDLPAFLFPKIPIWTLSPVGVSLRLIYKYSLHSSFLFVHYSITNARDEKGDRSLFHLMNQKEPVPIYYNISRASAVEPLP